MSYAVEVYDKTLKLLMADKDNSIYDVLKAIVKWCEENRDNVLGFSWYDVHAPPQLLNKLVLQKILRVSYKSSSSMHYKPMDLEAIKKALEDYENMMVMVEAEEEVPHDLFKDIILYDDVKSVLLGIIMGDKPVHVLFVGPPASGKTLFMLELSRLPKSEYILGSSLSKAGLIEVMFTSEPKYLIIDELDKISSHDDIAALLSLMETGIISIAKHRKRIQKRFKTWVFAAANSTSRIPQELLSRFLIIRFKQYTLAEFIHVSEHVLINREKVEPITAKYIIERVAHDLGSRDPRDCIKIARAAKRSGQVDIEIIDKIIKLMKK